MDKLESLLFAVTITILLFLAILVMVAAFTKECPRCEDVFCELSEPEGTQRLSHIEYLVKMEPLKDYLRLSLEHTKKLDVNENLTNVSMSFKNESSIMQTISDTYNFVHGYIDYDWANGCQNRNATCALKNAKGVCTDYSYLLVSMLRENGIYAEMAGAGVRGQSMHMWVEVYLPSNSGDYSYTVLPLDPTWGYMSENHVKTVLTMK